MDKISGFGRDYRYAVESDSSISSPSVSLIVPFYESHDTIERAAISALTQETDVPYETVFVDDGSNTPLTRTLDKIVKDPRVKVLRQDNKGVAEARNLGVLCSEGKYISLLDSDDEIMPKGVDYMTKFMVNRKDVSYAYSDAWWVGPLLGWEWENYSPVDPSKWVNPWEKRNFDPNLLLNEMWLGLIAGYPKKSFFDVGGYRPDLPFGEDHDLALKLSEIGNVERVPHKLHRCYVQDTGLTMSSNKEGNPVRRNIVVNALKRRGYSIDSAPQEVVSKWGLDESDLA